MALNPRQHDLFQLSVVTELPRKNKNQPFNRSALTEELLALNNPNITKQIAELVANEVDKEIDRRRIEFLSNEVISEMVAAKLEELGLIAAPASQPADKPAPKASLFAETVEDPFPTEVLEAMAPVKIEPKGQLLTLKPPARRIPLELSLEAVETLQSEFCLKDEFGKSVETAEEAYTRVARSMAEAEIKYAPMADLNELEIQFYNLLASKDFLPEGSILKNSGQALRSLSSSVAIPVRDSTEAIFEAMKQAAVLHKHGIAAGFSFTHLRPRNDAVRSGGKVSSGPVSFMKVFHLALQTLTREGSKDLLPNHGILSIDHPDILDFIDTSSDEANERFRLSVSLTDEFLGAVESNQTFSLVNPRSGEKAQEIRARQVFKQLVQQAQRHSDLGILFSTRLEHSNPTPQTGPLDATASPGGTPLTAFESCLGGAVNLANVVEGGEIQWEKLKATVHRAVHFLDNAVSVNRHPFTEAEESALQNRKIEIGVMGWADLLAKLEIDYATDEAVHLGARVMDFIQKEAEAKSAELAQSRGAFLNWDRSVLKGQGIKRRNATVTGLIATASLSRVAGCSEGIEPLNPLDVPAEWHLRTQATFQNHAENSVYKRIPIAQNPSEEEIAMIFLLGYHLGVKGIQLHKTQSSSAQTGK